MKGFTQGWRHNWPRLLFQCHGIRKHPLQVLLLRWILAQRRSKGIQVEGLDGVALFCSSSTVGIFYPHLILVFAFYSPLHLLFQFQSSFSFVSLLPFYVSLSSHLSLDEFWVHVSCGWTWCKFKVPILLWIEFQVNLTKNEEAEAIPDTNSEFIFYLSFELTWWKMRKLRLYLKRILSFVWFEFGVHLTEDEEAEAELNASSKFLFELSFELTW